MTYAMSLLDKAILNCIQSDFPLESRPFEVIGTKVGVSEEKVLSSVRRLKNNGIIRRIGGNFVPSKVGFVSTLCAATVPEDKLELFSNIVNGFSGVTHNYIRNNNFNVWFTFIAESQEVITKNLNIITKATGIKSILNLPAIKVFKIKAEFNL